MRNSAGSGSGKSGKSGKGDKRDQRALKRLIAVLLVLTEHPQNGIDADALIAAVGTYEGTQESKRDALARDIRALRKQGHEIVNVTGDGVVARYQLTPGDNRIRLSLSPKQLFALQRAAVIVGATPLAGVGVAKDRQVRGPDGVAIAPLPVPQVLGDVQRAVATRAQISFEYSGRARLVDPYGLRRTKTGWLLYGWEHQSGTDKSFGLQRMSSVRIGLPNSANPPTIAKEPTLDPLRWELAPAMPATVRTPVRFQPDVIEKLHEPDEVRDAGRSKGEQILDLIYTVTNPDIFSWRVLSLGERVQLIGGDSIRANLQAMLRGLAEVE